MNPPVCPTGCPAITLTEGSQFEVMITTGTGALVVLKHAIVTLEETTDPEQQQLPTDGGT